MKLFLSSHGIPPELEGSFAQLFDNVLHDVRLAYIPNAQVPWEPQTSATYGRLRELVHLTVVNLEEYRAQPEKLKQELLQYDGIWVGGGNTYYLRYMMSESGLDDVLFDLVDNGLVYAGSSAGSIVAGPTLKYFDQIDDPRVAPDLIWQGLRLTEFVVVPHATNPEYRDSVVMIQEKILRNHDWPVILLHDGQAVVIDGDNWHIVPTE